MLPWIIALVILVVLPIALRFADDHPRNDDPPDSDGDERDPGPALHPAAA